MGKQNFLAASFALFIFIAAACQRENLQPPQKYLPASATGGPSRGTELLTRTPDSTVLSPTLPPTPTMLGLSAVLLKEDFSGTDSCLESYDNERARAGMEAGGFVLVVLAADEIANANCETLVVSDFALEVDVRVESYTPGGTYYFGVLLRVSGEERYAFVIGSEGGYCVYYASGNQFVPLTSSTDFGGQCWTQLPQSAVQAGQQRLRVETTAERIDVYLNGVLLAVVRDGRLRSGWVGFVAAAAAEGDLKVIFDNLLITRK